MLSDKKLDLTFYPDFYVSFYLAFYLAFYLEFDLALYLAFCLTEICIYIYVYVFAHRPGSKSHKTGWWCSVEWLVISHGQWMSVNVSGLNGVVSEFFLPCASRCLTTESWSELDGHGQGLCLCWRECQQWRIMSLAAQLYSWGQRVKCQQGLRIPELSPRGNLGLGRAQKTWDLLNVDSGSSESSFSLLSCQNGSIFTNIYNMYQYGLLYYIILYVTIWHWYINGHFRNRFIGGTYHL